MDRKRYWNKEYTKYWKEATLEADSDDTITTNVNKFVPGDFKTPGESIIVGIFDSLDYSSSDRLLDYGCGFGRFFSYFYNKVDYYGIDISESMIDECKKRWPDERGRFRVAEGEQMPFEDDFFDKIICFGVFDACYQEQALAEMLRVLKVKGKLLFTGKNTRYFENDEQAYIAENAARIKGHPNFFTDVAEMRQKVQEGIVLEKYYLYRGDFAVGKCVHEMPEKFYEWCFVLEKHENMPIKFERFSSPYSETWKNINS